jgi:hypothetical protein
MRRVHGSSIADGCSSASHTSNVKCMYVGEEEVPLPLPLSSIPLEEEETMHVMGLIVMVDDEGMLSRSHQRKRRPCVP